MTSREEYVAAALQSNVEFRQEAGIDISSALVRPIAQEAWRRFQFALKNSNDIPNCEGREDEFSDYEYGSRPSQEEAANMCDGCPFYDLCRSYARKERPTWGVLGGQEWSRRDLEDIEEEKS